MKYTKGSILYLSAWSKAHGAGALRACPNALAILRMGNTVGVPGAWSKRVVLLGSRYKLTPKH